MSNHIARVEWQAAADAMLYLSYARGFKSGGFNGRPLVSADEVSRYDPEEVAGTIRSKF